MKIDIYMTIRMSVEVDIESGVHTEEEIRDIAQKKAAISVPRHCEEFEWEWIEDEPRSINKTHIPHDQYWMQVGNYTVATNRKAIVFKGCNYPDFPWHDGWLEPSEIAVSALEKYLVDIDFMALPKSKAWFYKDTMEFYKAIEGLEVRSANDMSLAYFILQGELIAAVAPVSVTNHDKSNFVTFNC